MFSLKVTLRRWPIGQRLYALNCAASAPPRLEVREVVSGPPVSEAPWAVDLGPFVIERMTDLWPMWHRWLRNGAAVASGSRWR